MSAAIATRRVDMDYLRVGALALLILYHVLSVYDSAEWWRLKSDHAGVWADYIIAAISPWRMPIVFFVGGVAAWFMLQRMTLASFARDRAAKLLTAFVFAVVVLIPPQRYVRLDDFGQPTPDYFTYLIEQAPRALSFHGLGIPDVAHAWFLPYLFAYSLAAALFARLAPRTLAALQSFVLRLPIMTVLALVAANFVLDDAVLAPWKPETRLLFPDITAHVHYGPIFGFGFLVASSSAFRDRLMAARGLLAALAATSLIVLLGAKFALLGLGQEQLQPAVGVWRGLYGATMLFAILAFAARFLNTSTPLLAYATDAILPVYLIHQTTLVLAGDALIPLQFPAAMEFLLLLASALILPLALYHFLVRPFTPLRLAFGLRPKARSAL